MTTFRRKPVEVEAFQWDGTEEGANDLVEWMHLHGCTASYVEPLHELGQPFIAITNPIDGTLTAGPTTWIIRSVGNLFALCSDQLFSHLYEAVPA